MMTEVWRTYPVFPAYEVSSLGRVRNATTGYILAQNPTKKGYLRATLRSHNVAYPHFVARMVCMAFHGLPPFKGAQAAHLDGSKTNNVPENLAWVSCRENHRHKIMHGTTGAKITVETAREIIRLLDEGHRTSVIATQIGVTPAIVSNIKSGRTWAWLKEQAA